MGGAFDQFAIRGEILRLKIFPPMDSFEHLEDVLGQLPFLKTYSHLLVCFPLPAGVSQGEVEMWWKAASLQLTASFPWLAGQVIQTAGGSGSPGNFKVVPCDRWAPPNTIVSVKDYSDRLPPFEDIIAARGPISQLDGDLLAPRKAFPESYQETDADPAPVLALQLNFVKGGILVDCAAQHNLIDMSGIEQCLRLLATALRGESFPSQAVEQGNRDRRNLVPLLNSGEAGLDHSNFLRHTSRSPPPPADPDSPFLWRYYRFSRATLGRLKAVSRPQTGSNYQGAYISTNDALSAFCWQRIIAARLRRRGTPNTTAKFCRAVNARPAMGVTSEYMGNLVTIAMSSFTFEELVNAPLSKVAATMRSDLFKVNHEHYIRSFATFIATQPDRTTISFGGNFNPDTDVGSSSWAHVQLYSVDFGTLGKPSLVRRPNFVPLKSDIYFMPQTEGGDIDALLCFNQVDFDALDQDEEWNMYAVYIG